MKKKVTVYLSEGEYEKLCEIAHQEERSMNGVFRNMLKEKVGEVSEAEAEAEAEGYNHPADAPGRCDCGNLPGEGFFCFDDGRVVCHDCGMTRWKV